MFIIYTNLDVLCEEVTLKHLSKCHNNSVVGWDSCAVIKYFFLDEM